MKYTKQCFNKMDYQLILCYPSLQVLLNQAARWGLFPRWMDGQVIIHHKFCPIFIPQTVLALLYSR